MLAIYLKAIIKKQKASAVPLQFNFLSREGKVLKELIETYNQITRIKISYKYLEVSRRSLARILVADGKLQGKHVTKEYFYGSVEDLWINRFGVPKEFISDVLNQDQRSERIEPGNKFQILRELENANKICPLVFPQEHVLGKKYLSDFFDAGTREFIICDIGYSGTMQDMLESILNMKLQGLYLVVDKNSLKNLDKQPVLPENLSRKLMSNTHFFEHLFNSEIPTVAGYEESIERIVPLYLEETIRKAYFKYLHKQIYLEALELLSIPESLLSAWVEANYYSTYEELVSSDLFMEEIQDFENLWCGIGTL